MQRLTKNQMTMGIKIKETKKGEVMINEKYIRFDWAVKRMLRDKANFDVLEGLITVLLGEKITIEELLESEGNQEALDYGVAKAITEHISLGQRYNEVKKVYSINILYFDLGQGSDYLYHGRTTFVGVHTGDQLKINIKENNVIRMKTPEEVYPEYFLIRVNEFNDVATTPIEEWLDYLKNGRIKDNTSTPGLAEAREKLQYMQMNRAEQIAYERHLLALEDQKNTFGAARLEGLAEGRAEGRAEGEKDKALEIARKMKAKGFPIEDISAITGLDLSETTNL